MRNLARRLGTALAVTSGMLLTLAAVPAHASAAPGAGAVDASVYVALGDSFTAGPLILPQTDLFTCARSGQNYPALVAQQLHAGVFRDVSCSAAATKDFAAPQKGLVSGVNPPQYDALSADTTLVTIGIGGNDIGLVGLATGCIALDPDPAAPGCAAKNTAGGVDVYGEKIAAFAATYDAVIKQVRDRAPHARVVLVGYPTGIRDGGCYPLQPLRGPDATYVQAKIDQLNAVMKQRALANGASYVDLRTPSIGHDACALPGARWLEGLVPLADAAPLHPNRLGMIAAANEVVATLTGVPGTGGADLPAPTPSSSTTAPGTGAPSGSTDGTDDVPRGVAGVAASPSPAAAAGAQPLATGAQLPTRIDAGRHAADGADLGVRLPIALLAASALLLVAGLGMHRWRRNRARALD